MIIVCEPIVSEQEHVPVNTAFIAATRLAFPDRELHFLAEEKHLKYVKEQLSPLNLQPLNYSPIEIPGRHSGMLSRILQDCRLIQAISRIARQSKNTHVILLSANHNHLFALGFMSRSKYSVHVILHGGLGEVAERRRNPFARALNLRHFLKMAVRGGVRFIVLESWILRGLRELLPEVASNTLLIPHPVPPNETPRPSSTLSLPLRIGFLGFATPEKGFDSFLALASDARWRSGKQVTFDLIGRLPPDANGSVVLEVLPNSNFNQRLRRDEYVRRLQRCDLVYVCLDESHYGYSASGVLLDAIAWEKPILCGGPLIEKLATESGAKLGYLCDPADAASVLDEITNTLDDTAYRSMVDNLRQLGSRRTIQATAELLSQGIDQHVRDQ